MNEQWQIWKPHDNLFRKYNITTLKMDDDGLIITMDPYAFFTQKADVQGVASLRCIFAGIGAMHCADESLRYELISDLGKAYGDSFYGDNTFFTVQNSSYLAWISRASCTISDGVPYVHYAIIAANDIIDILCVQEPRVEFYYPIPKPGE